MAKLPAFAKAFAGRWRIVEMDVGDKDFLDLVEMVHLTFKGTADGEIAFGALKGFLDVRYGTRDGSACAEFSWEGYDENDPASGRGWVVLGALQAASPDTSTSTTVTIQARFAISGGSLRPLAQEQKSRRSCRASARRRRLARITRPDNQLASRSTNERTPFKLSDVDRREVGTITTRWSNGTRPNFTSKRYCM